MDVLVVSWSELSSSLVICAMAFSCFMNSMYHSCVVQTGLPAPRSRRDCDAMVTTNDA
jgi:hypothetical protein